MDPVHFSDPDPDPVDPKKTGSGSYLDKFFMFMALKIKDKRGLFEDKGSGSGIFPDPGDPKKTGSGSALLV